MNNDHSWLLKKAWLEDNPFVSVDGVIAINAAESAEAVTPLKQNRCMLPNARILTVGEISLPTG